MKSSALAAPVNLSVGVGKVLVADGALNLVGRLRKDGTSATVAANQPGASDVCHGGAAARLHDDVTGPRRELVNTASGLNMWGPVAKGFLGATNLALGSKGEIDVTEPFAVQISVVRRGRTSVFATLPGAPGRGDQPGCGLGRHDGQPAGAGQ